MANNAVYKFLKDQNRPFSLNEVLQNAGKEYGKTAIERSLEDLTKQRKIFEKIYGKQKIYCVMQDESAGGSEMGDELRQMDQKINTLSQNVKKIEENLHIKQSDLQSLQSKMTTAEAKMKRNNMRDEILRLKNKLQSFKDDPKPFTSEEKTKITNEHDKYLKEYRKRKRICMDILNSVLENYPKTKKHLFEDIGIETDEDVKFTVESL